jgi:hypothetical protein
MLRTAVIADYVTKDWTIDEIVFRIHGVIAMLHTAVGHSCSVCYESFLSVSENWDYDNWPNDEEWAADNDVDWDEIEDRRID